MDKTSRFIRETRRYARDTFPWDEAVGVIIKMKSGNNVELPVPGVVDRTRLGVIGGVLVESELLVLANVPDSDKPGMTSQKIQIACGYKDNRHTRRILRRLMDKGYVLKDANGYRKSK